MGRFSNLWRISGIEQPKEVSNSVLKKILNIDKQATIVDMSEQLNQFPIEEPENI